MTTAAYPAVTLLGMPSALSRSMAHALLQAWEQEHLQRPRSPELASWQCLAPLPAEPWPSDSIVFILGQDWRDTDPDPAIARQITHWRGQLDALKQPYVMLYGKPSAQWLQLAESLKSIAPYAYWNWISDQNPWKPSKKMRRKACEQCGDPECEKALFEKLRDTP
jgi:hypothetical protein